MSASSLATEPTTDEVVAPLVLQVKDSAEWYLWAIEVLSSKCQASVPSHWMGPPRTATLGENIVASAKAHLERRLRDYLCPLSLPRTEQQAMAMLRTLGQELLTAGKALDVAAEALKFAGKGHLASQVKQQATKTKAMAEGLVG